MLAGMPVSTPRALPLLLTLAAALLAGHARAAAPTGARAHFAPRPAGDPADGLSDDLERGLWRAVQAAAARVGRPTPALDPRLGAVARALAGRWREDGRQPGIAHQEHLLSHHGLGDPPPTLVGVRLTVTDGALRARIAELLPDLLAAGRFGRVGIGVHRRLWNKAVVVALQRTYVEMLPVPRQLPVAGSALVAGTLGPGVSDPRVLVAPPAGEVRGLPVRTSRDSFQTSFGCDGRPGRHQVEVMGTVAGARTVLVNFPVFCGVAPPSEPPPFLPEGGGEPETLDPGAAAALARTRVNADRAAAGLRPVAWDEALARVARAHSEAMAARQLVSHVLGGTGNAADRVRRAGVDVAVVLENVACAPSIAEAQRSFMSSPGHRANVLAPAARRFGAGVALRRTGSGARVLYVTQLFAP
jgi:hypothetical protein